MKVEHKFECGNPRCYDMTKVYDYEDNTTIQQFSNFVPTIDYSKVTAISDLKMSDTDYRKYYSFTIQTSNGDVDISVELHWGYASYEKRRYSVEALSSDVREAYRRIMDYWKSLSQKEEQ